ncbi:hypothetical protein [Agromyces bracchium]|uniref:Uncharacterized protein n=1 Tax=Agromyces bracchium TaxID=88376 RepID=A0A6I3M3C6_9MICO|nr:hypothetical protein [Agromyces bracchium]MTH67775.1 hypothetical protein [Agromyces bracchium]
MPRALPRLAALALTGAVLVLAACAAPPPPVTPTPTTDAADTPLFATDEEALAAAVEAYEEYLAVSDSITADVGVDSARIREVTTPEFADFSEDDFAAFRDAGLRTEGSSTIDSAKLAEFSSNRVTFYGCQDVSAVKLLNSADEDVTPSDREPRIALVITAVAADGDALLVDGNEVWSGDNFC